MSGIGAVILAAGAGTRMGGVAKALVRRGKASGLGPRASGRSEDPTFLARIVGTAREVGTEDVVVVVGPPFGEAVAAEAEKLGTRVAWNAAPERGMASSVAIGFGAVEGNAAWLWPVDHPDVTLATLRELIAALGTHEAARPVVGGRGGHPPLVARALWPRLAGCAELAGGARAVLAAADVVDVAVGDPGCVRDVDTVEDLT